MNTTGPIPGHSGHPGRDTVESDPAYDFAEDVPVDEDWDAQDEFLDAEEAVIPPAEFIDAEERVVPVDSDEFREPED
ncbi:hypothetical protein [Pseudarthrobacter sp. N5]|uniref:hypothetical protein n=1 Tax=Pseudarthrobacter sp. N5 TaxID=3418416 RepID=UPI003CF37632